jgi:hypothetical protein
MTAKQRASRKWYLKNAERKRRQSLANYYKNRDRYTAVWRETYYIRKYLGRRDYSWIMSLEADAIRKVAQWYATLARLLILRANARAGA